MTEYTRKVWIGMVDRLEKVIKQRDAARAMLRKVEWVPVFRHSGIQAQCPECFGWQDTGHRGDCDLKEALG